MSPAEAWDVLAGIAHGKAVRIGKPLAERLLRDPSVHLVALAVTAILKLLAAHSSGSAGGTLIAAVLARSDWQKVYGVVLAVPAVAPRHFPQPGCHLPHLSAAGRCLSRPDWRPLYVGCRRSPDVKPCLRSRSHRPRRA
jgi:alpha-beta hydrolase superfamily lysophospholipase